MICTARPIIFGDQIEKNDLGGACSTYGERRCVYRVLVGKPGGKRSRGGPSCRWGIILCRMWGYGTGSIWLRIGTGGVHL